LRGRRSRGLLLLLGWWSLGLLSMSLHRRRGMVLHLLCMRLLLLLLVVRVLWLRCLWWLCGVRSIIHGLLLVAPSHVGLLLSSSIRCLTVPTGMVSERIRWRLLLLLLHLLLLLLLLLLLQRRHRCRLQRTP